MNSYIGFAGFVIALGIAQIIWAMLNKVYDGRYFFMLLSALMVSVMGIIIWSYLHITDFSFMSFYVGVSVLVAIVNLIAFFVQVIASDLTIDDFIHLLLFFSLIIPSLFLASS